MWTSAALQSLFVTSMPIVKILGAPIGAHVKLDSMVKEKLVPVSSSVVFRGILITGIILFHYLPCTITP